MSRKVIVSGYDVAGHVMVDDGRIVLLNNNSTHYLVCHQRLEEADFEKEATVLASEEYGGEDATAFGAFVRAVNLMVLHAQQNVSSLQDELGHYHGENR